MDDLTKEFLIESGEGLDCMERCLADMQAGHHLSERVAEIFRAVHTIKGTVGFLGFPRLERLAHVGEALLGQLREGKHQVDAPVIEGLVRLMDRLRRVLQQIESTGEDDARAGDTDGDLIEVLKRLANIDVALYDPEASGTLQVMGRSSEAQGVSQTGTVETTLRVGIGTLNRLMHLVGELVQTRNQILQSAGRSEDFPRLGQKLDSVTADLRETAMQARMQPVEQLFQRFPRVVREVAQSCGKCVRLEVSGGETGLDKSLLEALKDPLTHAVRNAIDHGIEPLHQRLALGKPAEGKVHLRAFQEGGFVVVEVSDDGAGIARERVLERAVQRGLVTPERARFITDAEAIQMVFEPGFSTRDDVTMISGRGVGMDVVRSNVERAGGSVELHSVAGQGTTLRMRVPLTLAIVPALVAWCGGQMFAIPRSAVLEMVAVWHYEEASLIQRIGNARMYSLRNRLIPLLDLSAILGLKANVEHGFYIAVLEVKGRQFGLIVDDVADPQEIVVKPLSSVLRSLDVYSGATLLGSGEIALILDVNGLARTAKLNEKTENGLVASVDRDAALSSAVNETGTAREPMLVFNDHRGERSALPLVRVERIESIAREAVEFIGGQAVMQYRSEIVRLDDPGGLLKAWDDANADEERLALICQDVDSGKRSGLVVREVLDVSEGEVLANATFAGQTIAHVHGKLTAIHEVSERKPAGLEHAALKEAA